MLVQTPPALTSTVQRIGRAGHRVGQVSRGILFPLYGHDFVEAAVASLNLPAAEIEPVAPVEGPLDVLAQVLLSMTAAETWDLDELYAFIKTCYPYRRLPRKSFDLVLEMLAGRYADTRLRELKPRVILDQLEHTVKAREGAARLVYLGGGTIPTAASITCAWRRAGPRSESWTRSLSGSGISVILFAGVPGSGGLFASPPMT